MGGAWTVGTILDMPHEVELVLSTCEPGQVISLDLLQFVDIDIAATIDSLQRRGITVVSAYAVDSKQITVRVCRS
jgi:hypothetical protein